jgi:hypothetical protein
MSTQTPVREEQQTRGQAGLTAGYAPERQNPVVPEVTDTPRGLKPDGFSGYARPNGPR